MCQLKLALSPVSTMEYDNHTCRRSAVRVLVAATFVISLFHSSFDLFYLDLCALFVAGVKFRTSK